MGAVYTPARTRHGVRNNRFTTVSRSLTAAGTLHGRRQHRHRAGEQHRLSLQERGLSPAHGKENVIRKNLFAFNKENNSCVRANEEHTSFSHEHHRAVNSGNLAASTWKNDRFVLGGNLYWDARSDAKRCVFPARTSTWKARGHDTNSVMATAIRRCAEI